MAQGITTAFWGMTINNYDDNELALVRNGYPDYMREIVHTLEVGEKGTPHIQAWIKLQRQQRMSFVKKLFPRAKLIPLTSDEYVRNTKEYAQKLDDTAAGPAVHKFNDPIKTLEPVVKIVVMKIKDILDEKYGVDNWEYTDHSDGKYRREAESRLVLEDYKYAKVFVSATYEKMWKLFGWAICQNILTHTHTHTHSDEKLSREGGITDDGEDENEQDEEDTSQSSDEGEDTEGQDYEDDSSGEDSGRDESDDDEYC